MERDSHAVSRANPDDVAIRECRNDLALSNVTDQRGTNKRRLDGGATDDRHVNRGLERFDLSPKRVSFYRNIETPEGLLSFYGADDRIREQDEPSARAKHWEASRDRRDQRFSNLENSRQFVDNTRLPAGDDDAVDSDKIGGCPNLAMGDAEFIEHQLVFAHIALKSEYANRQLATSHAQTGGEGREDPRR